MIGSAYKNHKINIIDLYDGYLRNRGNINDGVNLEFLKNRIESLKNGKYTLAVAGEVKAGKSTFINALLGVELLPSDVLQTSSAIVEILKSDNPFLKIKYADEAVKEYNSQNGLPNSVTEFRHKLSEVCSINDEYRKIPATLINDLIIDNGDELVVTDEIIKQLEARSHYDLSDKKETITEYIEKHPKSKIPVEIHIGYPLKWQFDELRIVDSPGVNAVGGVQDISFKYFEDANAIVFIHRIEPIESESFRNFVNSVITERSKETLFLVLTHAGLKTENDVSRLHTEAKRLFKNDISEEKILVVDSILQLIYSDLKNDLTVEQVENSSPEKAHILLIYPKKAKNQNRVLEELLLEYSQFKKMFETIEKFSQEAPNLQLREILEKIIEGYRNQEEKIGDEVDLKEKKKKNPQKFVEEIERIKKALDTYENLVHKTKEDLEHRYTGRHSEWNNQINDLKAKYPELINQSKSAEKSRKYLYDALNEVENIVLEYSKSITNDLNIKLQESGKKFQEEHKITIPKVDLDNIAEEATKTAYIKEDIYERQTKTRYEKRWYTLWLYNHTIKYTINVKVGEKDVYDEKIFLDTYKTKLNTAFYNIVNDLPNKSKEVLQSYLSNFEKEIKEIIRERKTALDLEKANKQSNDELIKEIEELKTKKKSIEPELVRATAILEDLT